MTRPNSSLPLIVARQPVFDRQKGIYGYELLFRANAHAKKAAVGDGNMATSQVIDHSLNLSGFTKLVGPNTHAFINFPRESLLRGDWELLPPRWTVVELLEDVPADAQVVAACRSLKQHGYQLALDDFLDPADYAPLLELADIIKIDFMQSDAKARKAFAQRFAARGLCLLAEKVETHEDWQEALELGYTCVQGYFFCKPQIVVGRAIPANKRTYLLFLREVNRPEASLDRLEDLIKREASLSYKLLRYLNSPAMGLTSRVESIRHALVMMGEKPLRKWASLVALTCVGEDKANELTLTTLLRARACELLAGPCNLGEREFDLFMLGMLSTLDALLDQPLDELLMEMPLAFDVKAALMGGNTRLARVLQLVKSCERGNLGKQKEYAEQLGVTELAVAESFSAAIAWAQELLTEEPALATRKAG